MSESNHIAAQHRDHAPHAHRSGTEHQETEDHLSGHERSRQGLEHYNKAYLQAQRKNQEIRPGHAAAGKGEEVKEEVIALLAYELWQRRNCPEGSPDEDWFRAEEQLHGHGRSGSLED